MVTVVASVAIFVTLLAHYANVLANSSSFSDRAVSVVRTGAVEALIVDAVTRRVEDEVGYDPSLQPLIKDAVRQAVSNGQITGEIRAAAGSLQSQLASGQASALILTLPDAGSAVASTIRSRSPQLADVVSRVGTITVLDVPIPSTAATAIHDLATVGRDSSLLIVFSVAMVCLALLLSPDRRRTLVGLGLGAVVSGLLGPRSTSSVVNCRQRVLDAVRSTAARAAWSVYLGGLESSGLVLAGLGALVAVVAVLLRPRSSQPEPRFAMTAR